MDRRQNLVLTGFMGTGKTTVGKLLAQMLAMDFVDTDDLIEEQHGPIPQIFAEMGEDGFRAVERSVVAELGDKEGLVIATGGGTVFDSENRQRLSSSGRIFCLVASPDTIVSRVLTDPSGRDRPMLSGTDPALRVAELMSERHDGYSQFEQVNTDQGSPEAIADEIAAMWRN